MSSILRARISLTIKLALSDFSFRETLSNFAIAFACSKMRKFARSKRLRRRAKRLASCRNSRTGTIIRCSRGAVRSNSAYRRRSKTKRKLVSVAKRKSKSLLIATETSVTKRWLLLRKFVDRKR